MDANSNSKSPSTAKIVDHVVSIATRQSNVDVKMASQKRYNRKSWMQAIKCISGVLMFIFLILLVCASYVELERKISKNESQINLCLQKIQKLSRDNRRLKLQVRRLETETKFPGIVKKTSPEETLTFREEGLQTAKVGGSDTDQSSPSSSSQLQFPFLERNTKPLIRNKRRGGKKGSKGSKGKKKKCKCDLPAIHVQGSSTQQCKKDKSGLTGVWEVASWVRSIPKSPATFHHGRDRLTIRQSGLYLVYAQMTLLQADKAGFQVLKGNDAILTSCKLHGSGKVTNGEACSGALDSCSSVGVFYLSQNEELYLRENAYNLGAVYTENASFFGVVKIGNMCNPWVRSDLGAASLSNSKSPILLETTGRVRVHQDGIYLVYAQIALNVSLGSGYKVFRGNTILSECTMKFSSGSDVTCSTFGIFRLKYGEEIYIEESGEVGAVRYAQTYSSFGIVRVGR